MRAIANLAYALDKLRVSRRLGLYFSLWITYFAITRTFDLLNNLPAGINSADVQWIVAAIMVPVTGLQAAAIKFYNSTHNDGGS